MILLADGEPYARLQHVFPVPSHIEILGYLAFVPTVLGKGASAIILYRDRRPPANRL